MKRPESLNPAYLEQLIKDGMTEKQIGNLFGLSHSSIIYYKKIWNLQSSKVNPDNPNNAKEFISYCEHCGKKSSKRTCGTCASVIRHNAIKLALIRYLGSQCSNCGYDKCHQALDFHHLDENDKIDNVTDILKNTNNLEKTAKELSKCILLCSNCHRELHYNSSKAIKLTEKIIQYISKNNIVDKILNALGKQHLQDL